MIMQMEIYSLIIKYNNKYTLIFKLVLQLKFMQNFLELYIHKDILMNHVQILFILKIIMLN